MLGFTSASEAVAYWQAVLPHAPMPSAIMDRVTAEEPSSPAVTRGGETAAAAAPNDNSMPSSTEKILFPEDVFAAAGSVIDLYIDSSATLRTACKSSHDVADYVPMSAEDLANIRARYAPASLAMARDIWSTLNACDRLGGTGGGERRTCTASLRTMVEFAASVLGTRHLRAFSSSRDVPAEGLTSLPSPRYRVVAVRPVTTAPGSAAANGSSMTCHSMEFPSPAYYCHAVNPTRVYEVTLWREEKAATASAGARRMMRALAVCHIDSSGFDPNMSFCLDRGIKPGDAPACHFLSRRSVLWAPADAEVDGTAAPILAPRAARQ